MTVRGRCQGILAGRGSNQINECVGQVWSKCKTVPVGQVGSAVKQTKLGKLRDQVDRAGHYSYAQMMILKTIEITITIHTHTYTSILGDMQGAGVHSAGVDLDAGTQVAQRH